VSSIVINTANFRNEARRRKTRSQQKSQLFEVAIRKSAPDAPEFTMKDFSR